MQIVIDIPEEEYKRMIEQKMFGRVDVWKNAICNGTPLPKGHGRLIDESDLMPDSDYEDGIFYAVSIGAINGAPTIIEADTAESEGCGARMENIE